MDDKSLGYSIMVVTVVIMIGYFVWSFAPYLGSMFTWLIPYTEWAFKLPILAAVFVMLFIVLWIGYTMATTPPPIPLDNPLDLEREGEGSKQKE
ncbi:MAG: hypothetical protein NTY03_02925 [Candidatus Bathyarchaeota archaeon]|nr:hypothetical protein [Candidatus Bathyarchaeota archaeon]